MLKLKINDSDIELRRGEVVAISLQANSVEKPDTFQSSFSNSFDVLLTRSNRDVLGNLFAMGNSGLEYERITGTSLVQDGLQIVADGFAVVEEYNNQVATLTVYSGVNDFFDELGDLNLQSLAGLAEIVAPWSLTNVTASQSNDYTDNYIWAIADYGEVTEGDVTIDVRYQHPSVFVKALHLFIEQQTSWVFKESDFFINADFERLLTPFNNPTFSNTEFEGEANSSFDTMNVPVLVRYDNVEDESNWVTNALGLSTLSEGIANNNIINFFLVGNLIQQVGGDFTATISLFAIPIGGSQGDGVLVSSDFYFGDAENAFVLDIKYNAFNDKRSFYVEIDINVPTGGGNDPVLQYFCQFTDLRASSFGDDYYFNKSVPNIKCSDYLKSVWLMFGIVPEVDFTTKEITLRLFEEFTTDYDNAIDFSDKVDISKEILIENSFGDWGGTNSFSFAENEDISNSTFYNGSFAVSNALIDSEYDWIELDFSASEQIGITADSVQVSDIEVYESEVLAKEASIRIGFVSYYNSSPLPILNLTDGTSTNNNVDFAVCKFFDDEIDLRYSGLRNDYFDSLIKTIQAMQKLTVYLKLDAIDFNNIDFFVPYYLSFSYQNIQIRGYYLFQLVDEYKAGETAKCEFIRLNPF